MESRVMADDDEDVISTSESDNDASSGSTEGSGAPGQDSPGEDGEPEASVSTEQSDAPPDDGEPQQTTGAEPPSVSRGSQRFQRLNDDNRALKDELARLRQERQEEQRRQWARDQAVTEQQERERLALMTDSERADYRISKMERQWSAQAAQDRAQIHFLMDKNSFDAKATVHPIYKKYAPEVERRFQEQLAKGQPVEREVIFRYLLGDRSLEMALKSGGQARAARKRVENEGVRPSNSKGDSATSRGRQGDTPESRLKGVLI
jgi:hypothetical protein